MRVCEEEERERERSLKYFERERVVIFHWKGLE